MALLVPAARRAAAVQDSEQQHRWQSTAPNSWLYDYESWPEPSGEFSGWSGGRSCTCVHRGTRVRCRVPSRTFVALAPGVESHCSDDGFVLGERWVGSGEFSTDLARGWQEEQAP